MLKKIYAFLFYPDTVVSPMAELSRHRTAEFYNKKALLAWHAFF